MGSYMHLVDVWLGSLVLSESHSLLRSWLVSLSVKQRLGLSDPSRSSQVKDLLLK